MFIQFTICSQTRLPESTVLLCIEGVREFFSLTLFGDRVCTENPQGPFCVWLAQPLARRMEDSSFVIQSPSLSSA